jgi:hypothetical protein
MSPTDATAVGTVTPAGSPFGDPAGGLGDPFFEEKPGELFFEPEKSVTDHKSVTDASVANPFLPDSSQGDLANPFLQNSSHGEGTGADVKSTQANDDLLVRHDTIVEVPEDREAEIAEFVARLVASLIMSAVIAVSNELDEAFNDEVSNDKLNSTAVLTAEPSSVLLTATEAMSPPQASELSVEEGEDQFDGLALARRSLKLATGMAAPDISGLDLESYDEEFEGDSP